jgi:hypothetical protein
MRKISRGLACLRQKNAEISHNVVVPACSNWELILFEAGYFAAAFQSTACRRG